MPAFEEKGGRGEAVEGEPSMGQLVDMKAVVDKGNPTNQLTKEHQKKLTSHYA